jgi:cation:H+ antiporter
MIKVHKSARIRRRWYDGVTLKRAAAMYSLNALIVVKAAMFSVRGGRQLKRPGRSIVGTVFVAITTSLPELVCPRRAPHRAPDLAIGNILGNTFNILPTLTTSHTKGPLLSDISTSHAVTGLMAILMTAVALISITYRHEKEDKVRWDSLSMLAIGKCSCIWSI